MMKGLGRHRVRRIGTVGFGVAIALVVAGCAADAPQDLLQPFGEFAERVGNLWTLVFWLAVGVFVLVEGLLLYAIIRFRRRRDEEEAPRQVHGHTRLEIAWTIAPAVLLLFIAVPTVAEIFSLSQEPDDALPVTVTAHQFWWEYEYPGEEIITANELHIPVGQPVLVRLMSEDVIHSFWVPSLAGKLDVVPGREETMWLSADEPGMYMGQCAEFCGVGHGYMRFRVIAQPEDEFREWLESQRQPAPEPTEAAAIEGKRVFMEEQCVACHAIEGTEAEARVGPDLTHVGGRTTIAAGILEMNEENLRRWIRDSPGVKPGSLMPSAEEMGITDEQIDAIVAYLMTLR